MIRDGIELRLIAEEMGLTDRDRVDQQIHFHRPGLEVFHHIIEFIDSRTGRRGKCLAETVFQFSVTVLSKAQPAAP